MKYFIRQNLEILVFCTVILTVAVGAAALYFTEEILEFATPLFTDSSSIETSEENSAADGAEGSK